MPSELQDNVGIKTLVQESRKGKTRLAIVNNLGRVSPFGCHRITYLLSLVSVRKNHSAHVTSSMEYMLCYTSLRAIPRLRV